MRLGRGGRPIGALSRIAATGALIALPMLQTGCDAPSQPAGPASASACPTVVYAPDPKDFSNGCANWMFEAPRNETPHWVNPIEGRYDLSGAEPSRSYPWEADVWIGEDFLSYRPRPFGVGDATPILYRLRILERTATEVTARACRQGCRRLQFRLGRATGGQQRALRVQGLTEDGAPLDLVGAPYRVVDCEKGLRREDPLSPLGEGGAAP